MVANDYTVRFRNRFYQLLPPVHPGERGGRVVIELRLDGSDGDPLSGQVPEVPRSPAGVPPWGLRPQTPGV